eukprot:403337998
MHGVTQTMVLTGTKTAAQVEEFKVQLSYPTADKQQMFINLTTHDGNVTYVDQYGNEYFYGLENIFFRYKAEHYLEGLQNTLEMQLIHRSQTDKTQMLGVSVFFDSGMDFDNDFMQELDPRLTNVGQPRKRISLATKLFDDFYGNFFYYNGSMTVPPCTEKVQWFIYNIPIQISAFYNTQLFALIGDASYGGNYRAPQNQTGRTVQLVSKIYWDKYKYMRPYNNEISSGYIGYKKINMFLQLLIPAIAIFNSML